MKWNDFDTNIREYFRILREDKGLLDVTLVTDDGQHIQAHKIVLSAGSNFFRNVFLRSKQNSMLIYLKGINSVELEHLLDFIYIGETSVGQEQFKKFLETGKDLQVKGFEGDVLGVGESEKEKPFVYENEMEKRDNMTEENNVCESFESSTDKYFEDDVLKENNAETDQLDENSDLDLQITEMIEKCEGIWKCKVCGKTTTQGIHMRSHVETHIEGISQACHICNISLRNRVSLRNHINRIHCELLSCDLCGKSGMNRISYSRHKQSRQHKTLSGTL